jgi:hypothetical protein
MRPKCILLFAVLVVFSPVVSAQSVPCNVANACSPAPQNVDTHPTQLYAPAPSPTPNVVLPPPVTTIVPQPDSSRINIPRVRETDSGSSPATYHNPFTPSSVNPACPSCSGGYIGDDDGGANLARAIRARRERNAERRREAALRTNLLGQLAQWRTDRLTMPVNQLAADAELYNRIRAVMCRKFPAWSVPEVDGTPKACR